MTDKQLSEVQDLRSEGKTYAEIAEKVGIPKGTIYSAVRRSEKPAKRPKAKKAPKSKKCSNCGKTRKIEFYGRSSKAPDGYMKQCRTCIGVLRKAEAARRRKAGAPWVEPKKKKSRKPSEIELANRLLEEATRAPDITEPEAMALLQGAALLEGVSVRDLLDRLFASYRRVYRREANP